MTDVVRPGNYGLYSYEEAEGLLKGEEINNSGFQKQIKFTLRLLKFLKTTRIVSDNSCHRLVEITALALNIPYREINSSEPFQYRAGDLLIVRDNMSLIREAIGVGVPVFCILPSLETRKFMETPLERGMLLNSPGQIILIPRREMAYVAYDITLV